MFIILGRRAVRVHIRDGGNRQCPACMQTRPFSLFLEYQYAHLYFYFGKLTSHQFLLVCNACGNVWRLRSDEIPNAKHLVRSVVPFMKRWGCVIFLLSALALVILFFASIVITAELADQQGKKRHLGVPREERIYLGEVFHSADSVILGNSSL